jgi:hypothetical protein
MDDPETRKLHALCEQFRALMQRNIERTVFDKEACQRIGDMIGRSARQDQPEHTSRRR